MRTALIHTDHSECHHTGPPVALIGEDGGPLCPDGREVGWVQIGDRAVTISAACGIVAPLARMLTEALSPLTAAAARMCAQVDTGLGVRALAAAAVVIDRARAADGTQPDGAEQRARDQRPPVAQRARGFPGDPCGSPPEIAH